METVDLCLTRDDLIRPWGFRLQGGFETGLPLSVQRVFSGSPAEGVLQRGDIIKSLDNCEAQTLSSKELQDIIRVSSRELKCIVERKPCQEQFQDIDDNPEPKVSVKSARKKFLMNENVVPKPFGEFGTCYEKKNDSIPTNMTLDMNNDDIFDQNLDSQNHTEEVDDKVDYSFMKLSVAERKKLFANTDGSNPPIAMPRQRCYSVRPTEERSYGGFNQKNTSSKNQWSHGNEERINARNMNTSLYSENTFLPKSPIKAEVFNKYNALNYPLSVITSENCLPTYSHQPSLSNSNQTKAYVHRCGSNRNDNTMSRGLSVDRPLVVKTFQIRSSSNSRSPMILRQEGSSLTSERRGKEQWSNMSVRSDPFSGHMAFDTNESIRFIPDPVARKRNTNLGMIKLGESNQMSPGTLVTNFSPSNITWTDNNAMRLGTEQPVYYYIAKSNPVAMNTPELRREITVPRSRSNIIINPTRQTQDDSFYTGSRIESRQYCDASSDF